MSLVKPVTAAIVPLTSTYDDHAGATNLAATALVQAPGLGLPSVVALDTNGRLVPTTSRSIAVDTYLAASVDDMAGASLAAWPDGLECEIEVANTARVVTLRHLHDLTGLTDIGQLVLADGQDVDDGLVLDTLFKRVRLRRSGTQFVETGRAGFPDTGSTIGSEPQDFGGYQVSGMRATVIRAAIPTTLVRATHAGNMIQATTSGTQVLPNPNASGWQAGDFVLWDCPVAGMIFVQWDGNPPSNAFNHDRAYGPGAQGWVQVVPNVGGTALVWRLLGATAAPPVGGGAVRTFFFLKATADYAVPNDTATHTAHSLNHAYGASEKWLYLYSCGVLGLGTSQQNAAVVSFVQNAGSDVVVGQSKRPPWVAGVGRYGFVWGQTYGGSAGSATQRVDVANAATGFALTVQAPAICALRLETGEDYGQDLGPHSDNAGTYVDLLSWTKTTAADDFALVVGTRLSSGAAIYADLQLLVDGTAVFPAETIGTDGTGPHAWTTVWPVTLTAASHVFKLQVRRNALSATGTVTGTNTTIALLKKANFQQWNADSNGALTSYTSSTYTTKLSDSWTMLSGYKSLVLGTSQGGSSNHSTASAKVRFRRNAALLQPESIIGVRTDATFNGSSVFYMDQLTPALATDAFDVGGANTDNSTPVSVEGTAMLVLALGP